MPPCPPAASAAWISGRPDRLRHHLPRALRARRHAYGDAEGRDWPDNHIRFARLGLAAAELAAGTACLSWCPELIHANDWPAGLAPAYMAWRGQTTPSVFTIHNLAYQGLIDPQCSPELGLPPEACSHESMEFYGKLSFLKAGIAHASHVTTVSENYAHEITTEDFGCGLEGMLKHRVDQGQLSGITNGIDELGPAHRRAPGGQLQRPAVAGQAREPRVRGEALRPGAGRRPLFAVVSRLVQQKGIDLTLEIADAIVAGGGRMAIIGRGEPALESAMQDLAQRHPRRIGVRRLQRTDARRMFAGSDFLLMPSRFEPCGLSQMYAQRFGSLPIARRTGGLADHRGWRHRLPVPRGRCRQLPGCRAACAQRLPPPRAAQCHALPGHGLAALLAPVGQAYDRLYKRLLKAGSMTLQAGVRLDVSPYAQPWALLEEDGTTRFALWAPDAGSVEVELADGSRHRCAPTEGWYCSRLPLGAGTVYRYLIDGTCACPTRPRGPRRTAPRLQPGGRPKACWRHADWRAAPGTGGDLRTARRPARRLRPRRGAAARAQGAGRHRHRADAPGEFPVHATGATTACCPSPRTAPTARPRRSSGSSTVPTAWA